MTRLDKPGVIEIKNDTMGTTITKEKKHKNKKTKKR
jgi:hypothetical protein